ncbi:MAG: dockerin type I repeat-containing protein [archaeon]|nr:dockerin type I repeat-containing protein [archaeon]
MDKKTTMIVAIVAVVIVAAAGCVVVFGGNNGGNGPHDVAIASQLQIRGNANDDYTINADDMAIVDDIIAGNKKLEDYKLADVNADGKVDETDKNLLQDLIDRKDGCKVFVVCVDENKNPVTVEATYPLRNVVPYGTNMQLPVLYANAGQYMAGYFTTSYKTAEASISDKAVDLKGATRQIPDTAWTNFTKLDSDLASKGGVGALLVDYSGIAQITAPRVKDLEDAGIPMICYSSADSKEEVTTVLTLGFLFGGDCEKLAVNYAKESWKVFDAVKEKVGNLEDSKRTSYIAFNMHIYVCCNDSTFNSSGADAGGIPYYKVNADFAKAYAGSNSVKMNSTEALSNYRDAGALLNTRSMDWGLTEYQYKDAVIETWNHDNSGTPSSEYFKGFEDRLTFVNNLLPGGARLAYYAHALYGDKFSEGWADSVLQNFINLGTDPLKGQNLNTIVAHIDKDVYDKACGKEVASESAVDILSTFMTNYKGTFATGADDAKFAFANGSVPEKAVIKVANGNTSGYSPNVNSITVQVTPDAKTLYDDNEKDYSAQVGKTTPMGATYVKANVTKGNFAGLYGYYLNITSSGSASGYITGYVGNVFFETYFFQRADMTDADFQGVADAMYDAIFKTVKYSGPAIPEDIPEGTLVGAAAIADTFASENAAWTVSSDSTETEGILDYVCPTKTDKVAKVRMYVGADAATLYATKAAAIAALNGTTAMGSKNYATIATPVSVPGVKCTAVLGQLTSSAFLQFAMLCGNTYVEIIDAPVYVYLAGADAQSDAIAMMNALAASIARADSVAIAFATVNSDAWKVAEGATATEATLDYTCPTKTDKVAKVKISVGDDAATKYAAKAATISALNGTTAMGSKNYATIATPVSVPGVECTAVLGQLTSSAFLQFTMQSGNAFVEIVDAPAYIYIANAAASDDAKAMMDLFAAAITA